ncbi:MAG: NAD-dependent protein deacylase [Clostridiales bacterium]|nr:NAD-dependent protein deacylase [Clostridiales bacterium]
MQYPELTALIRSSQNIVFFGGAGVSTESGIPDFRSADGIYNQKHSVPPETLLSHDYFFAHPKEFFDFYREKMICPGARPNAAHLALAKLESEGKLSAVITQNIDGLHTLAGSKKVFELHGCVNRNICLKCRRSFGADYILSSEEIPKCPCGGLIKPDVVLYGEPLDDAVVSGAVSAIRRADLLIVAGTSLTVYPAAGFVTLFRGQNLVLINKSATPMDSLASLIIRAPVGAVLGEICGTGK